MVGGIGGPGGGGKVGGPGAPGAPPPTAPTEAKTGKSFAESLDRAQGTATVQGPTPLERLRAGEIDLKSYVEIRVQQATSHLEGVLSPGDLEKVRAELEDVIEQDPDVAALVKAAEVGR